MFKDQNLQASEGKVIGSHEPENVREFNKVGQVRKAFGIYGSQLYLHIDCSPDTAIVETLCCGNNLFVKGLYKAYRL